ncbi:MAG: tetratricopeptide repeat protein [Rhodospirillales bacterium]|nr:tetratricopeptide repeat protein [Rhodospirillales bacterium]
MRASRTSAVLAATMIALRVGALAAAQPSPAADVAAARWYRQCMQLTDTEPQKALDRAEAKAKAQGDAEDVAAGHCAAVALVRLERFAAGASRFEELAGKADRVDLRAALLDQAADAWLLAGNAERALKVLTAAVEIAPKDADLRIDKAQAEAELGRYGDAAGELDSAIALDPGLVDAYVFRASARRRLNQMEGAAADLEKALTLDPRHPEALLERGVLRQLDGDRSGARADWDLVVAVAPDSAAAQAARVNLSALAQGSR